MAARGEPANSDVRVIFVHWAATNLQVHDQIADVWKFDVSLWERLRTSSDQLIDPIGPGSDLFTALTNSVGADFDDVDRVGLRIRNGVDDVITYDIMMIKQLGGIFMVKMEDKAAFLDSQGWEQYIRSPLFNLTNFTVDERLDWGIEINRMGAAVRRDINAIKRETERITREKERLAALENKLIKRGEQTARDEWTDFFKELEENDLERQVAVLKQQVLGLKRELDSKRGPEQQVQSTPKRSRNETVHGMSASLAGASVSSSLLGALSGNDFK